MQITEVKVIPATDPGFGNERIKAFSSICFDNEFVVHDIKVVQGTNGLFLSMPSRKLNDHCHRCRTKVALTDKFCHQCGSQLDSHQRNINAQGRIKFYADIAHPINNSCREKIKKAILDNYRILSGV